MTKPKIPKSKSDADWDLHASKLALPEISDTDWSAIFDARRFREGTENVVKDRIRRAILLVRRMNSGYDNIDEYREKLSELLSIAGAACRKAVEFEKYNYQRLLTIGPLIDFGDGYKSLVMREAPLRAFSKATAVFGQSAAALGESASELEKSASDIIAQLSGEKRPGPNNDDIYWLISELNKIVLEHSNGGRITRSRKNRSNIGNDERLVRAVCEIARRGSGRPVNSGTIDAAIRSLRANSEGASTEES